MAEAPVKPKAGGKSVLKGKVGPVPVPVLIFAVVGVAVYLYLKHRSKTTSQTSAGTNSGTDTTGTSPYPTDSTGGGAQGGGATPDLSSLLGGNGLGTTTYNYYSGGGGGGNTSPPGGSSSTQPQTSFPDGTPIILPPGGLQPLGTVLPDGSISLSGDRIPYSGGQPTRLPGQIVGTQSGQTVTGESTPPAANPQPPLTTIPTTLSGNIGATTGPGSIRPNQITGPGSSKAGVRVAPGKAGGRALA